MLQRLGFLLAGILCFSFAGISQSVNSNYHDGRIFLKLKSPIDLSAYGIDNRASTKPGENQKWFHDLAQEYKITEFQDYFKHLKDPRFDLLYEVYFEKSAEVENLIKALQSRKEVIYAEKVPYHRTSYKTDDLRVDQQYTLAVTQAFQAWDIHRNANRQIVVAIVDDAVRVNHEDLIGSMWVNPGEIPNNGIDDDDNGYTDDVHGYDVANDNPDPSPLGENPFSHGTHCAGIAGATSDNGLGVASLGFDCKIMGVKTKLNGSDGPGLNNTYGGIVYAIANNADIISMSFGSGGGSSTGDGLFTFASERGTICIAAAGNDNTDFEFYPAAARNVISVASTSNDDSRSGFSNYGPWIDISAPGSGIMSTVAGSTSSYEFYSGTSMACPNVAGLAAYLYGYHKNVTRDDVLHCMLSTADDIDSKNPDFIGKLGAGRINTFKAIDCLANRPPDARAIYPVVHYINAATQFADKSLNGQYSKWEIGDLAESQEEVIEVNFPVAGTFPVRLEIAEGFAYQGDIHILPTLPLPYTKGTPNFAGDFENASGHFAVHDIKGSSWQLGNSSMSGKNGTNSGSLAFTLAPTSQYYTPQTQSVLYTPMFDFTANGMYELSFFAKFNIGTGLDGFHVEYTTDNGRTWQKLGYERTDWYNYTNTSLDISAYPLGDSYFSGRQSSFKKFRFNVSEFSGLPNVAFRFVFRSQEIGFFPGLAIDDFEISKLDVELLTKVIEFTGNFTQDRKINIKWKTLPEYYCQGFRVEVSTNGRDYEDVAYVNGNQFDIQANSYQYTTPSERNRDLYFYRLYVENYSLNGNYEASFYTNPIAIRKNLVGTELYDFIPNPFSDFIDITFSDVLSEDLEFSVFDVSGRQVFKGTKPLGQAYYRIDMPDLASGAYFMRVHYGANSNDTKTIKIIRQ
jgi:hypothetical protein